MKLLKRILKDEAGQALPMALILLVLGGFLVVPTLALMTTNLTANRIIEVKTSAIYAADAGIQDALWKLGNGILLFESSNSYDLPENINGMTVTVEKVALVGDLYTLKSTATSTLDNKIKAVITAQARAGASFDNLFKNALTSAGDVDIGQNCIIYGDIVCGDSCTGDTEGVNGYIYEHETVILPTEAQLTAYYLSKFDAAVRANPDNYYPPYDGNPGRPYTSATLIIPPGYTYADPYPIPWLYCTANKLSIVASSDTYAKLTGNIFLAGSNGNNGQFELSDKDVTLDLNGYTIYATYSDYPTCGNTDAIYFGSGTYVNGPGCIIGVGNVNFQPTASQGDRLLGTADYTEGTTTEPQDRFVLSRFQCKAAPSGELTSIQVKCYIADPDPEAHPAHVKVALYADNNGAPGTLKTSGTSENITISSWKPVDVLPPTTLDKQRWYWLAAIADADIICTNAVSWTSKYRDVTDFTSFQFPPNATDLGQLYDPDPPREYLLRGYTGSQQFFFLMSVECTVLVKPNGNFYGSIAGNANVHLQPDCFVNLVNRPEGGLQFPGSGTTGMSGDAPLLLNYNIQ